MARTKKTEAESKKKKGKRRPKKRQKLTEGHLRSLAAQGRIDYTEQHSSREKRYSDESGVKDNEYCEALRATAKSQAKQDMARKVQKKEADEAEWSKYHHDDGTLRLERRRVTVYDPIVLARAAEMWQRWQGELFVCFSCVCAWPVTVSLL